MSDYKSSNLVVQSNQFVRGSYSTLKANEIKMFDVFVSCIDTLKPKTKIEITKSELLKAMGDNGENYTTTRDTLNSIFHKGFYLVNDESTKVYHFIDSFEWFHNQDIIKVEFHKDILPMLVDLKTNFLTYSVLDLKELKSKYSMVLYKYILSYIRQYKTKEIPVEISEIRKVLNLKNKYKEFKYFKKYVLDVFVKEVNSSNCLPYLVQYAKKVRNRKVETIVFLVRERTSNSEHYFSDVKNGLIAEQEENKLLKLGKSEEEIKQHQADSLLSKPLDQRIEEAKQLKQQEDDFSPFY